MTGVAAAAGLGRARKQRARKRNARTFRTNLCENCCDIGMTSWRSLGTNSVETEGGGSSDYENCQSEVSGSARSQKYTSANLGYGFSTSPGLLSGWRSTHP